MRAGIVPSGRQEEEASRRKEGNANAEQEARKEGIQEKMPGSVEERRRDSGRGCHRRLAPAITDWTGYFVGR
jgi:hypothetical protein